MHELTPNLTITLASLLMAMAFGLIFGMGPCLISCMPFLGPVFLSIDSSVRQSWKVLLPLSLGRLCVYAGLGAAAGMAGSLAEVAMGIKAISGILGVATLLVGLGLLIRRQPTRHACVKNLAIARPLMPGGLFLMGIGMGLTPCAPLSIVLASAAATGTALSGLSLGLSFGIGAIAVPSLVYGIGVAYFGARLREKLASWRGSIERLSACLMIFAGLAILFR
jgi:thiol:disulfide interchange protein DsbD